MLLVRYLNVCITRPEPDMLFDVYAGSAAVEPDAEVETPVDSRRLPRVAHALLAAGQDASSQTLAAPGPTPRKSAERPTRADPAQTAHSDLIASMRFSSEDQPVLDRAPLGSHQITAFE